MPSEPAPSPREASVAVKGATKRQTHKRPSQDPAPTRQKKRASGAGPGHDAGQNQDVQQSVVRDSFTMPANDYARIASLKKRCLDLGIAVKKSELLRAGLHALEQISDANLTRVVSAVERIKTGRPLGHKLDKSGRSKESKA
jgi:hypothetical protein